MVEMT